VSWRLVYASEVGTSHAHTGTPCQDSCWATQESLEDGSPLLCMFVADGAGSAQKGGEGAELAIEAAVSFVEKRLIKGEFGLGDALAADLIIAVREHIYSTALAQGLSGRDYACTFLGVLSCNRGTLVLQIGDGGVVLDTGAGLELAIIPMSGEYANMTSFVTDEGAVASMQTKVYPDVAVRVAAFTDGIQRLALNMAENTPHEPFFAPFFAGMGKATAEQEDQLNGLLAKFLGSQAVNERTDDDKTLALALWGG
jgi:hypothetical protein